MDIIYNSVFLKHDTGMHPENRKRLESFGPLPDTALPYDETPLAYFHDPAYIERARAACRNGVALDQETVTSPGSFEAAVYAVQATLLAARQQDFALVRPPGHHAHEGHSSGFCIFNNVGIAAEALAREGQRVAILDFDSHLGDGTVRHFHATDRVFYWSIHQFPAFPGGGDFSDIGEGPGRGYTLNMPLPPGTGDDLFIEAIERGIHLVQQFRPDVLAVSAGFDGHQHDLLLDLRFSAMAYHAAGLHLRAAFPRVFATLEGGYNVLALPRCLHNFIAGMNGTAAPYEEPRTESDVKVRDEFEIAMGGINSCMADYWKM